MKHLILITILFHSVSGLFAQSSETTSTGGSVNVTLNSNTTIPPLSYSTYEVYNNGPLVNSPGTGAGGADESVLQNNSLGMNLLGFGFQIINSNEVADDFTLTSPHLITSIIVYAYQTGSPTTSSITDVRLRIYDGNPSSGGTLVWGDASTNRLVSSTWSGIYRVTETSSGDTNRPIMECTCNVNTTLPAGTYWLDIQVGGTLGSGPWCPPVTITGSSTTGNGIQGLSGSWGNLLDSGTATQQAVPFILIGGPAVPFNKFYLFGLFALIGIGVLVRKRLF